MKWENFLLHTTKYGAASAAAGFAYDTQTGKSFYFQSKGTSSSSSDNSGWYGGATILGLGVFNGTKDQFLGKGLAQTLSVGLGFTGSVTKSTSSGATGYQLDLVGPGIGATWNVQDTVTTCPKSK